jgi:hypothetical protein
MLTLRMFVGSTVVLLAGLSAARADQKKIVVPGDPPLTQDMVDDYAKFLEWRLGPALAKVGGSERMMQMIINDWENGDAKRREVFLVALKWWRGEYSKLSKEDREKLTNVNNQMVQEIERMRHASNNQAIQMLILQQAFDARQLEILTISNIRAKAHEVNMQIIRNIGPSGRYEYNPSTGRYDRWVPYR